MKGNPIASCIVAFSNDPYFQHCPNPRIPNNRIVDPISGSVMDAMSNAVEGAAVMLYAVSLACEFQNHHWVTTHC